MCYSNSRICRIYRLPAMSASSLRLDLQFLGIKVEFLLLFQNRKNFNKGKRCFPSMGWVERRKTDKPVHARFTAQIAISIFAPYLKSRALYPALGISVLIKKINFVATLHTKPEIHPLQYFRPVLRVQSPRSGMNRDYCPMVIISTV